MDDVRGRFDAFLDMVQKKQVARLQMMGEQCVNYARTVPPDVGFHDQTGNLRSSIGYGIFVDGVQVHESSFESVGNATNGAKVGQELCKRVGNKTHGVCLVVVAGMNYAVHVESKGRDVITGAEHLAQRELPKHLERLINNIRAAAE